MSFSSLLTQRCLIARKTSVKNNDMGFVTNTWVTVPDCSSVPCRIEYMFVTSSFLSQTPNGQISGNDYIGMFEPDTNIQVGDRITWNNLYLYARPVNFAYASGGDVHHLEIMFGLQES